jgi:hypothetical protein
MAITRQLTPSQTESVKSLLRAQIGVLIEDTKEPPGLWVRESFALYTATVHDLLAAYDSRRPLAEACRDTGTWHHQVAIGEEVSAFGRIAFGTDYPDQGRFLALMNGRLCRELDQAIQLADRDFNDDYTALLVRVPEVNLYFLLLTGHDAESILVVSSMYAAKGLEPLKVLSYDEFGSSLRRLPKVVGIDFS